MSEPRPWISVGLSLGFALIPNIGPAAQILFDALDERSRYNAQQAADEFARGVDPETVAQRMSENPALETVLAQAFSAATGSGLQAKRKLLARAAAAAFLDDARVDSATLTVFALSQLEPVHIKALAQLIAAADSAAAGAQTGVNAVGKLQSRWQAPIRAALIFSGVAAPATMWSGDFGIGGVTEFGRQLLEELRAVADEDNERLYIGDCR